MTLGKRRVLSLFVLGIASLASFVAHAEDGPPVVLEPGEGPDKKTMTDSPLIWSIDGIPQSGDYSVFDHCEMPEALLQMGGKTALVGEFWTNYSGNRIPKRNVKKVKLTRKSVIKVSARLNYGTAEVTWTFRELTGAKRKCVSPGPLTSASRNFPDELDGFTNGQLARGVTLNHAGDRFFMQLTE